MNDQADCEIRDGKAWRTGNEIRGADVATFVRLNNIWAKDQRRADNNGIRIGARV